MNSNDPALDLERANWWSALSEASLDAAYIAEPTDESARDFRMLYANSHGARLFGMTPEQLVDRKLSELISSLDGDFHADLFNALSEGRTIRRVTRSIAPELHAIEAEFRIVPFDGKVAVSVIDRSAEYAAEVANGFFASVLRTQINASLTASALIRPTLTPEGEVVDLFFEEVNEAAAELLGTRKDSLQGQSLYSFTQRRIGPVMKTLEECHRSQQMMSFEFDARGSALVGEWIHFQLAPIGDYVVVHATDITKSRREEAAFRAIVEHTAEFVGLTDRTGLFRYLNPHAKRILGLTEEEVSASSIAAHTVVEDRPYIIEDFLALMNDEESMIQRQIRIRDVDNTIRTVVGSSVALRTPNGGFDGVVTVATDLTDQLASEEARSELAAELAIAEQRERERLAESLHDGPVQDLTALSMKLGSAVDRGAALDQSVLTLLRQSEDAVVHTIAELRLLMFQLSAPDLEGEGLGQALRFRAERLFDGLEVQVHSEMSGEDPPNEIAVTLFRIGQEALVNARKHAKARNLTLELHCDDEACRLAITDDGVGAEESVYEKRSPGHLGIGVILDRARRLGGTCRITGAPGRGTRVEVSLPKRL